MINRGILRLGIHATNCTRCYPNIIRVKNNTIQFTCYTYDSVRLTLAGINRVRRKRINIIRGGRMRNCEGNGN